jgi:hypothetical protein
MPYNAFIAGTLSNKPYAPAQAVPTDARSYFYDTAISKYRPFQSLTEARTYLDTAVKRTGHFSIFINLTGTLNTSTGVFSDPTTKEYLFRDGVADADLVEKATGSGGTGLTEFTSF